MHDPLDTEEVGPDTINPVRLWVGGFATAIVAALVVVVGVFIARGILGIPVLAPKAASNFGDSTTAVYASLAAGCTLVATALLHVLLLGAPRPLAFFAWITALADVAVAAAPFTQPASLPSKVFTAVINVVPARPPRPGPAAACAAPLSRRACSSRWRARRRRRSRPCR